MRRAVALVVLGCAIEPSVGFDLDIRLFFICGADHHLSLLPHFLDHWIGHLGVEPSKVYPDVHSAAIKRSQQKRVLGAARQILEAYDVPYNNTWNWTGTFNSIDVLCAMIVTMRQGEVWYRPRAVLAHARVNVRRRVAIADVDEFPHIPGTKQPLLGKKLKALGLHGFNMLSGVTIDRVAIDGNFTPRVGITGFSSCITLRRHHTVSFHGKKDVLARCEPVNRWVNDRRLSCFFGRSRKCRTQIEIWHFKWWGDLEARNLPRHDSGDLVMRRRISSIAKKTRMAAEMEPTLLLRGTRDSIDNPVSGLGSVTFLGS
ncbi:hypothetical protein CTAYLR_006034 [Chrysophaeum taylorii]|uniref:Uncharacterized protein n=1 Tax=Chrysophaeum taylorii TaxID=2483200 RepID=A0AAD7UJQ4_9STRA|nr:hypothetical protein CTAYLR_006034 [Chrysophaeum taylorii]